MSNAVSKKRSALAAASALAIGLTMLSGCASDSGDAAEETMAQCPNGRSALQQAKHQGYIDVTSNTSPPANSVSASNEYQGYDADILREVAKSLDLDISANVLDQDPSAPIRAGRAQVTSGIWYNDERAEQLDFSRPYKMQKVVFVTNKDSGIDSIEDLEGLTLGQALGTFMLNIAEDLEADGKVANLEVVQNNADVFRLVATGRADASVQPALNAEWVSSQDPSYQFDTSFPVPEPWGAGTDQMSYFGVMKGECGADLLEALNDEIGKMQEDGRMKEIYESYGLFDADSWKGEWNELLAPPAAE